MPARPHPLPVRRGVAPAGMALVLLGLLLTVLGPAQPPAQGLGYSPVVDEPAGYDPQVTCRRTPQPGTVALSRWLRRSYPVTGSMGLMRACGTGGRSEHKDGRAFDWAADVRRKAQRRAAYGFIRKALAADSGGNAHALARRMGIMYLIYDDTIWSSYHGFEPRPYLNAGCKTRKRCSRTLRHLDHVHISLSYAGAAAQTSWYRARGVPSLPVLHPRTNELDADDTAVTGMTVPANGSTVSSSFLLRAGVTYRVVATGIVRHGSGPGDPNCVVAPGGTAYTPTARGPVVDPDPGFRLSDEWGWDDEGSDHPDSPFAPPVPETRGLLLAGALRWEGGGCQADHTYEAWFTPVTAQRLQLRYADPAPGDNTGTFSVYVARDDITRGSLARRG